MFKDDEIIFTSGATESNNLAIMGVINKYKDRGKTIITTKLEHSSILETVEYLERNGPIDNANKLLSGVVGYGMTGKMIGTMPNNGQLSFTPTDSQQTIPEGYTTGGTIAPMDITTSTEYSQCLAKTMEILE